MSTYGFEIVQTLIVDIEPDVHVKRAMNEINAGKTDVTFSLCFFLKPFLLQLITSKAFLLISSSISIFT